MSAQLSDKFKYNNKKYSISAIEIPHMFFNITKLGLKPHAIHSACWRGFVAEFGIGNENRLVLVELKTNNGKAPPPKINGIEPKIVFGGGLKYHNLNLPINYSGKILITSGFIKEKYVHMGFQSPLSYENIIELSFENGIFTDENDMSALAAQKRREQGTADSRHYGNLDWINKTFNLSYDSKWL